MKTVVVTGATSGIGNLIVKDFINQGYRVFAGYRNVKLKRELSQISENIMPFYIDMSKKWSIPDAIKLILEKLEEDEKINVLVNAAGCVVAGPMECLDVEKIKYQFEVNTFAQLEFTQGLFGKLDGGRIINISSTSSFGVYPFIGPYCASKRSLDMMFNCMEIECQGCVKVISVKPGVIKTPLWEKSIEENQEHLQVIEKYEKELNFLMENAKKASERGLNPQKVSNLVMKIVQMEKPKSSYVIGLDAKIGEFLSHLPQDWSNAIISKMLKKKYMI